MRKTLVFLLVLVLVALVNFLVHEAGHCITMEVVGGECDGIYVTPGIKIWPLSELGQPYPDSWDNYIGLTRYFAPSLTEEAGGLVSLMGSGSVAVLSLLALVGLYVFRPMGWGRILLLAQSLMFLDLLFYTILPHWLGLRHLFIVGGNNPEPLNGAIRMGIPESTFIAGVLIFSALMIVGMLSYILLNSKMLKGG